MKSLAPIVALSNGASVKVLPSGGLVYDGPERPIPAAILAELRDIGARLSPPLARYGV